MNPLRLSSPCPSTQKKIPLRVVLPRRQRDEVGARRRAEHRPPHRTAAAGAPPRLSIVYEPTRRLLLRQRSPRGTKKSNSKKSNSKKSNSKEEGKKNPTKCQVRRQGGSGAALLNVPSLAAEILDFPTGKALIIYYWQPWRCPGAQRIPAPAVLQPGFWEGA